MPFDGTQLNATAAHLLRAKRYIEEHGWSPLGWSSFTGSQDRCVLGAMVATDANGGNDGVEVPKGVFKRAINSLNVPEWNNAPGRTVEEVYAAFDRAITLAMEDGGHRADA